MSNLIVLVGRRGSGKSTLLTLISKIEGIPFYSNIIIKDKNYKPLVLGNLEDLETPSMLIIDEGYGTVDSRESQSRRNMLWSHIAFQLRKRDLTILIAVQQWSALDIRIRKETDYIIKCELDNDVFYYSVLDNWNAEVLYEFSLSMDDALKIFPYFDTNEVVKSELMKDSEYYILKNNREAFLKRLVEIAELIRPMLDKVYLNTVKTALVVKNIDIEWHRDVYNYLKGYVNLEN